MAATPVLVGNPTITPSLSALKGSNIKYKFELIHPLSLS